MTQYFDFPKKSDENNNIHLIIYVPSTVNINQKIPYVQFKRRIAETVTFLRKGLSKKKNEQGFGGSTRIKAIGNYNPELYRLSSVTENICKIECFTNPQKYNAFDLTLKNWLLRKKKQWKQQSISYEYEEQLYFV